MIVNRPLGHDRGQPTEWNFHTATITAKPFEAGFLFGEKTKQIEEAGGVVGSYTVEHNEVDDATTAGGVLSTIHYDFALPAGVTLEEVFAGPH